MTNIGNYFEISNFVILFLQKLYVYFYRGGCCKKVSLIMNTILPPSPPPYCRRSDHLPCLAEAAAGPEDVVLVLVAAPSSGQERSLRRRSFARRRWRHRRNRRREGMRSERCGCTPHANKTVVSICSLHRRPEQLFREPSSHSVFHPQ